MERAITNLILKLLFMKFPLFKVFTQILVLDHNCSISTPMKTVIIHKILYRVSISLKNKNANNVI